MAAFDMLSLGKPLITSPVHPSKARVTVMLNPAGGSEMHLKLPPAEKVWDIIRTVVSGLQSLQTICVCVGMLSHAL